MQMLLYKWYKFVVSFSLYGIILTQLKKGCHSFCNEGTSCNQRTFRWFWHLCLPQQLVQLQELTIVSSMVNPTILKS